MTVKERCDQLMKDLTESQLELVLAYIQSLIVHDKATEDQFCEKLYQDYHHDPDKDQYVDEEDVAQEFGITL